MIEEATKPSIGAQRKGIFWPAIVVAAFTFPILYALSSGPTLILAMRYTVTHTPDEFGRISSIVHVDVSNWWQTAYSPLVWASQQSWGESLRWYWEYFFELG